MKVLLLENVKGLGQKLDVVDVKDGYARNFLIPNKLAEMADKKAIAKKAALESEMRTNLNQYQLFAKKLSQEKLELAVKTGNQGEVFEPVSKESIKKALTERGYKDFEVNLPRSIKTLGEYEVEIKFPNGIKGLVSLSIKSKNNSRAGGAGVVEKNVSEAA